MRRWVGTASARDVGKMAIRISGQSRSRFVGPVVVDNGQTFVEDPYRAGEAVRVPLHLPNGNAVSAGDVVEVTVGGDGQARLKGPPLATSGSVRAQMYGIFARHQIDPTFPPDVMKEVAALQKNDGIQSGLDSGELKDFRDKAFVTIDNTDSRDLDQAMYIEKHQDGSYDVFYALADASHYVKPDTALFNESLKRAASIYLPGLAVPMLPAELSEDLVSLNPGKDRRAMVMKLTVDKNGKSAGTRIERGVINSRAKLAYDRVNAFHDAVKDGKGASDVEHHGHDFTETLMLLKDVGELRMQDAAARDVVSFRRTPVKIVTNVPARAGGAQAAKDAPVFSVIADERNDVERWNEQISLLANIEGANFFLRNLDAAGASEDLQAIFRVHDAPPSSRIDHLHGFITKLVHAKGLDANTWQWDRGNESLAKYLARLPADGDNLRVTRAIHQTAMVTNVRSDFSAQAGGHHGVGTKTGYARFSSPMRELVGIFVHKEAFEALLGAPADNDPAKDSALRERIIEVSNAAKQIQGRVTKEANKLAIDELFASDLAIDFKDRRTFKGTIMGVRSDKIYVQLDAPPIDVKVYLSGAEKFLGGDIERGKDGVSVDGVMKAVVGDAIDLRLDSYDETSGRYHLVPILDDAS